MATEEEHQFVYENGYCGIENNFHDGMPGLLDFHLNSGFHFVFTPLMDPAYRPSLMGKGTNSCNSSYFPGLDSVNSSKMSHCLVGKISSWIDLDSDDEILRKDSEITLREEVHFASALSLQVCLLPAPKGPSCANYARCVNHILQAFNNMQFLLRIPLEEPHDDSGGVNLNHMGDFLTDSVELWRCFYRLCELKFHNQLSVALDFPCSLPSASSLACWSNEPVKAAIMNSKTLRMDSLGGPYKMDHHQRLMVWLFSHSIKIVLYGVHPKILASSGTDAGIHNGGYRKHPLQSDLKFITFVHGSIRDVEKILKSKDQQLLPRPKVFEKNTGSHSTLFAYKSSKGAIATGAYSKGSSTIGVWLDDFITIWEMDKLYSG